MKRKLWLKFMDFLWSRLHSIMTPLCHKKHTWTLIYSGKNSNEEQRLQRGDFNKKIFPMTQRALQGYFYVDIPPKVIFSKLNVVHFPIGGSGSAEIRPTGVEDT